MSSSTRPSLTAWMIVRDEAANLADCLASLDGVVDRVVVVDTGSVDDTVAIAEAAGAEVHHIVWGDDFAAARNAALEHCRGDWLLWIDADERLLPVDRARLDPALSDPTVVAARVALRRRVGFTPCGEVRLFRPHPDIRFEGSVHGDITDAVERLALRTGGRIVDLPVGIDHVGYEGDQSARHARNLPMLRARLAREPDHVFCLTHLGQTLEQLGELDEARAAFERAVEVIRSQATPIPQAWLAYDGLVRSAIDDPQRVRALLDEGAARGFGSEPSFHATAAQAYLALAEPAAAIPHLEVLAAIDPATYVGTGAGLPEAMFGAGAATVLGDCRWEVGDTAGAVATYERACALDPTPEAKAKLTVARSRATASP